MKKPSKYALKRAKATLAGRILCRILGEETGAVLMEYVVLGVLIVAAVVAAVMMFGETIKDAFATMAKAIWGQKDKVEETRNAGRDSTDSGITDAGTYMDSIQGNGGAY